ncbi:MAG: thiamine phosphate synthase [Deltaproteobacteria bacterium]|nr:thiamine phosphate synthase [Deltaproteobacteria bacterium]
MSTSPIRGLYGIADVSGAPGRTELEVGRAFLDAGVTVLQLRMKGKPRDEVRAALLDLRPLAAEAGCALLVNDDVDLAAEFDDVGVHLGQGDLNPRAARARLGPEVIIGWSTHDASQVRLAADLPVDYVGFGPVFSAAGKHLAPTDTRTPMEAVGLASLSGVVAEATVPVVAIGGIDEARIGSVMQAGAAAAAVISAVACAENPASAARDLASLIRDRSEGLR